MKQTNHKGFIIAIDGHSSCGKSTFAKAIAAKLGYLFIDTGAMYRAVTLAAKRAGCIGESGVCDEAAIERLLPNLEITFEYNDSRGAYDISLAGESVERESRQMEISSRVSAVAAIGAVREKLVSLQREMGKRGGVVMDGRDIGTVVFPEAEIKIYMTASAEVRAERRYKELQEKGDSVSFAAVLENVVSRDFEDENRKISPLRRAEDALLLDNSQMTPAEQMAWFEEIYRSKMESL